VLLKDPYDAVRFNAQRTLARYPAFAETTRTFGVASTAAEHFQMAELILPYWTRTFRPTPETTGNHFLIRVDGSLDLELIDRLTSQRDDREFYLSE